MNVKTLSVLKKEYFYIDDIREGKDLNDLACNFIRMVTWMKLRELDDINERHQDLIEYVKVDILTNGFEKAKDTIKKGDNHKAYGLKYMREYYKTNSFNIPYEVLNDDSLEFEEGTITTVLSNKYERNTEARNKCLEYYGYNCQVCDMNFKNLYGDIGKEFIEVHHIKPISEIKTNYKVHAINDLIPVCSNCHSMLHRKKSDGSNPSIEELKILFN